MRFSVVINTYNRADSLRATLDALRHQTFSDFEVVVVNGPSDDGTADLLAERAEDLRTVSCPERNLAVSRNLGIDAAAGDVVAFIDDDAIPEPRWLGDLARAYERPGVGAAGGLTLDPSGTRAQYRYSLCSRVGITDFDRRPPFDAFNRPGADPFVYLQGTNCSFRRDVLEQVEGFDEEIEYNYDESELCSRIIDAGFEVRALPDAVVHHKFLPSHMRRAAGFTDPFLPMKNRVYFALRVGAGHHPRAQILASLTRYLEEVKAWARDTREQGRFDDEDLDFFLRRADEGFAVGLDRGLAGVRRGRAIARRRDEAFRPYPILVPDGRRLCVCFVTLDYPPRGMGGIARFTHDLARGFAAAGHEAHVVTRDDDHPYRIDFEEGVWVHRFPVAGRWLPGLEDHPLKGNLDHLAAVHAAVERVAERAPLDVVSGSLWIAEPLLCALDPRWSTSVACNTPISKVAELQPETAAAPLTPLQAELERALLRSPARLQPVSAENARLVAAVTDKPMEVVWHGLADRRDAHRRQRADDDGVEVLFVGRLEPRKGIDTLLEGVVPLLRERPWLRLRVVGADNPHANGRPGVWQRWVADHAADVSDRIRFTGEVSDDELYGAYADCDVFCAPSRYESFGLVHVEAMMMGRPVVAADAGGMRETVLDGETGRLVAPGDAAALRAALAELVDRPDLRERMGAAARRRYEAEFAVETAVARNVELYRRLAEGRDAAAAVPDAQAARRTAAAAAAGLLVDLCGADPATAQAAAENLLDPGRFPTDFEHGVRRVWDADPEAFVDGVYRTILGRAPDRSGLSLYLAWLDDGRSRREVVRHIASSVEARAAGVDPGFVDRLPVTDAQTLEREVRSLWLRPDDAFAAGLHRALVGRADAAAVARDVERLAAGTPRSAVLRDLVGRPDVGSRVFRAHELLALEPQTLDELVRALRAVALRPDRDFVDGVYRALLGRPADPGGLEGYLRTLRDGRPRPTVLRAVAASEEAQGRGVPADVAAALPRLVGQMASRRRLPGAARLRRAAMRARDAAAGVHRTQAAIDVLRAQLAETEGRLQGTVERTSPAGDLQALERRLEARLDGMVEDLGGLLDTSLEPVRGRLDVVGDRLASRLDPLAGRVQQVEWAVNSLREQIEVMARKHEAMAMDVREKIPTAAEAGIPDPEIPDPEGLARRLEEIGGVRLNLGCGEKPLPGYVNVDFRPLPGVDVVADVRRLPFEPGTVEEIASHHLVEHFRQHQLQTVILPYWRSLLVPDGVLRTVTPNWAVLVEHLDEGRLTFGQFKQVTFGLQDYSGDDHFAMYSPETFAAVLEAAGYADLEVVAERRQNGLSPEFELLARPAPDRASPIAPAATGS